MDRFNLTRTSKLKIDSIITKKYGGRYSRKESWKMDGSGTGGLIHYKDGENGAFLKCNIELLKQGIAIYFRDLEINDLLLFNLDEIESISLAKEMDLLNRRDSSLFSKLIKSGIPYFRAKILLLEKDIIHEYPAILEIKATDYQKLEFEVIKSNPYKIAEILKKLQPRLSTEIQINIQEYGYI